MDLSGLLTKFEEGGTVETGELVPATELLKRVDAVFLESNDGRVHLEQALEHGHRPRFHRCGVDRRDRIFEGLLRVRQAVQVQLR